VRLRKIAAELRRGARMAQVGGPGAGLRFVREEVVRNAWLRATAGLPRAAAAGVECNVCGWRGARFLSHCAVGYVDRNTFCPRCRSYPRHRGFAWLWRERLAAELAYLADRPGLKVMFAPERGMMQLLEPVVGRIAGADLDPERDLVEHVEDLQRLSFPDGTVDLASCFHVLEHVPDDRGALRELRRVLAPDGVLLLCVPITFGRRETWDFGGPHPELNDHCFDYGEDFPERLAEAGLSGRAYRIDQVVPAALHARLGMTKETIYVLHRAPDGERGRIEG
jgi:SAM-dependent methyltransferase